MRGPHPRGGPRPGGRRCHGDSGSESVELAILLPVAVVVLAMLVVGGRVALAGDRISGVAGTAARAASLARSAAQAQRVAASDATTALAGADLRCRTTTVDVDTSGFALPPGTPATVTVTVSCTVDLSAIGVPGLPGSKTLRDTAVSPLDPARDLR